MHSLRFEPVSYQFLGVVFVCPLIEQTDATRTRVPSSSKSLFCSPSLSTPPASLRAAPMATASSQQHHSSLARPPGPPGPAQCAPRHPRSVGPLMHTSIPPACLCARTCAPAHRSPTCAPAHLRTRALAHQRAHARTPPAHTPRAPPSHSAAPSANSSEPFPRPIPGRTKPPD